MKHAEWKQYRCKTWDLNCMEFLTQECLDDPDYEEEEDAQYEDK